MNRAALMNDSPLKIGEFLRYLAPTIIRKKARCPRWPADVFAVAAALLEKSLAYPHLGIQVNLKIINGGEGEVDRIAFIGRVAAEWAHAWPGEAPEYVREQWHELMNHLDEDVGTLRENHVLCARLVNLLAVCDEVFIGVGLDHESDAINQFFCGQAEATLIPRGSLGSTLCKEIHPSRLRVLPKSQTPSSGLSLRSFTHHLALCPPVEVKASWHAEGLVDMYFASEAEYDSLNMVLIPWPFDIEPTQFSELLPGDQADEFADARWFSYSPSHITVGEIVDIVEKYVDEAESLVGKNRIDLVVFPESALTQFQYDSICNLLLEKGIGVVAGIASSRPDVSDIPDPWGKNIASMSFPSQLNADGRLQINQSKHHRWKLEQNQIVRYGLASGLDPHFDWWEGIEISDREINFIRLRKWLSSCVLICEDLARIDPIGRFVRAVAPDLVIALLLDGPQLSNRWPAYHATVLADDPGCSVLTLTSLGMTQLSTMKDSVGESPKRVIGMWRDSVHGLIEIALPTGATAAVLTLTRHRSTKPELTADGRPHNLTLGFPVYGGLNFIRL